MEKRKTICFSVPVSTLIHAAEEKLNVKIQFSYAELMEKILDDNSSIPLISTNKIFEDFFGGEDKKERLTVIKCCFEQKFLKELVENKQDYTTFVGWKDALSLALDSDYWCLNIPATSQEDEGKNEDAEN
ncbi:hypothetical protein [Geitlerinema sp. PCC 7407]|uniref:hypothetical protein n=1 Tax=Geitlerinema sp. PCC 7407 TaxID=1173025 RepID=UPI00029FEAA3|nr:hypothetical protein [Geitlerinema sp. PCC 7407]AFY65910.1 hypothetical protein GEI7407_1417 [Geitlerinema sp. PCC 7407]